MKLKTYFTPSEQVLIAQGLRHWLEYGPDEEDGIRALLAKLEGAQG